MIQQDAVLGERYKQAPAYGKVAVKFHTVWTSALKETDGQFYTPAGLLQGNTISTGK